jgi:uncharacterized RmlC-like cupin family protein
MTATNWRDHGVGVIPGHTLDANTPQTPGMSRAAAINFARVGAQKIWAGTVSIQPNAKTGPHHHGHLESGIYLVSGRARMRASGSNSPQRRGRATSSMCRPTFPTRKSTQVPSNLCTAC